MRIYLNLCCHLQLFQKIEIIVAEQHYQSKNMKFPTTFSSYSPNGKKILCHYRQLIYRDKPFLSHLLIVMMSQNVHMPVQIVVMQIYLNIVNFFKNVKYLVGY